MDEIHSVIKEALELNPHSVYFISQNKEGIYAIALDNLHIIYTINMAISEVEILKIILMEPS